MKNNGKKNLICGSVALFSFCLWTWLIQTVDVRPSGVNGTEIGFAKINLCFNSVTGVNMTLYSLTDWLGLVPVFVCFAFGLIGLIQLIKRKSLLKVDSDIILLGIYYVTVIAGYLIFETIPINYRPVLINGLMEASYPSSTTLLVLSVMPTLSFQAKCRIPSKKCRKIVETFAVLFSLFMVVGRIISGVHWLTDIVGSCLLSAGLFFIYKAVVLLWNSAKNFSN